MNSVTATVDLNAIARALHELPELTPEETEALIAELITLNTRFKVEPEG